MSADALTEAGSAETPQAQQAQQTSKPRSVGASGTATDTLLSCQLAQLRHDEAYHQDIHCLPVSGRMKHFALHMSKYAGRFIEAAASSPNPGMHEAMLVDAFIIALAGANTLNIHLGDRLGNAAALTVLDLGASLERADTDGLWFAHKFAISTGRLAKACEATDHLEPFPMRAEMEASIVALASLVIAEASQRSLDLVAQSRARLHAVERRNIHDRAFRAPRGELADQ